jgi:RNA polymerase sigma-70 factor (ECF subfamily)
MRPTSAELFERHHLAIYRYLLKTTGSPETAEDITQDVFVRVLKGLDGYEERDQERSWLFRIARNLRCDRGRREHRQPTPSPLGDIEPLEPARQDLQLSLARALAGLEEDDRDMFVLAEIGGLSYAEIGVICDASPAAVRSRIYRARLALRAVLESPHISEQTFVRGRHG